MPDLATNVLYYGDNRDIPRRYLPDTAVDLVYLEPPFNSNRDDNVIFRSAWRHTAEGWPFDVAVYGHDAWTHRRSPMMN